MLASTITSALYHSGLRLSARFVTDGSRRVWRVTVRGNDGATIREVEHESIAEAIAQAALPA